MKKSILLSTVIVGLLFSACSGGAKTKISEEKAKEIALANAGVKAEDVTFVRTEKDREDGKTVYEIEFYTKDRTEYDYEIDANTGDIISYDSDAEAPISTQSKTQQETLTSQGADLKKEVSTSEITAELAKEIALAKASGATEEHIKEFKTDREDGRNVYEGKIIYNNVEYDFEIDTQTGNVIKWETESVHN